MQSLQALGVVVGQQQGLQLLVKPVGALVGVALVVVCLLVRFMRPPVGVGAADADL